MSTEEGRLVDRIRQQFDAGVLPRQHPKRVFGGYGVGDACSGCGDQMQDHGVFEFEIAGRTYRFHTAAMVSGKGN